jgi:GT2 family glycosyltransferase
MEWDTPIGETQACGGDSMMRVEAFQQVGGFNPALIAGEEPELCVRLRQKGWKISAWMQK